MEHQYDNLQEVCFGRFQFDLGRRRLLHDGEPVELGGRALEILCLLASAKGAVLSKDELMTRLWPTRAVAENNLHVHISALRKALDERGGGDSYVVTVPGRGYRLAHPGSFQPAGPRGRPSQHLPLPDKPSIAVMPFVSADPGQEYFADGIANDLITALSRYSSLLVIARNSSFSFKGIDVNVERIGSELGVRYVLEGSVRKVDGHVRVTSQLVEVESGTCIWADRYDAHVTDIFAVQDDITLGVSTAIAPAVAEAERSSSGAQATRQPRLLERVPTRPVALEPGDP